MDKQEIFNKAYLGLKSQGFERSSVEECCLYRDPSGRKCAIGYLIPDELYSENMERYGFANSLVKRFPEIAKILGVQDSDYSIPISFLSFLDELQMCHDLGHTPEKMEEKLQDFAHNYSLTVPTRQE